MICDGAIGCKKTVEFGARVWVPSKTPQAPGHEFLRMMTSLHCCAEHRGFLDREEFMTDNVKAAFEAAAKRKRPIDYKCEFDNAFIEYVGIHSRDYADFLASPKGKAVVSLASRRALILPGAGHA